MALPSPVPMRSSALVSIPSISMRPAVHTARQLVDAAEEAQHIGRRRMVVDLFRRADLLDAAFVEDDHAVGELERLFLIVGDEYGGGAELLVNGAQPAPQILAHAGVERAERLVEQQHLGFDGKRPGERHALALAAGQLRRIAVAESVELHQAEQLLDLGRDGGLGRAAVAVAHAQAEGDVLGDRHMAEQGVLLEHETDAALLGRLGQPAFAVDLDVAAVGIIETGENAQQGGLARTRSAEQGDELAVGDVEIDTAEHRLLAELLVEGFDLDGHAATRTVDCRKIGAALTTINKKSLFFRIINAAYLYIRPAGNAWLWRTPAFRGARSRFR